MVYQNYAPRKSSTRLVWWILGGFGALIAAVFLTWAVIANINEAAKISKMISVADGIPTRDDWELVSDYKPRPDITCIPFDQSCHSLSRTWQAAEPVSVDELAASTGYNLKVGTVYRQDCADGWVDKVHVRLCTDGTDIELTMYDR